MGRVLLFTVFRPFVNLFGWGRGANLHQLLISSSQFCTPCWFSNTTLQYKTSVAFCLQILLQGKAQSLMLFKAAASELSQGNFSDSFDTFLRHFFLWQGWCFTKIKQQLASTSVFRCSYMMQKTRIKSQFNRSSLKSWMAWFDSCLLAIYSKLDRYTQPLPTAWTNKFSTFTTADH